MLARAFIFVTLLFAVPSAAFAQHRFAFVVGIDTYDNLPRDKQLQKAVNDARAIGTALAGMGFEVDKGENVTRREFYRLWSRFLAKLGPGDMAGFFFSGHGVDLGGNYLIPRDVQPFSDDSGLRADAISFRDLVADMRARGVSVSFEILDACRENPFADARGRSLGAERGLSRFDNNPQGNFIIYSAGERQKALDRVSDDDPNPNSIFTRNLLPYLVKDSPYALDEIAKKVRIATRDLALKANHTQFPAYYNELTEDVYLGGKPAEEKPQAPFSDAAQAWGVVQNSTSEAVLEDFIRHFPGTVYASFAQTRLNELKARQAINLSPADVTLKKQAEEALLECDRFAASPEDDERKSEGVEFKQIDVDRAVPACQRAVSLNPDQSRAAFMLGRAFGARHDYSEAREWYEKAAVKGDTGAMNNLGNLFHNGRGVPQDYVKAREWYEKAAAKGQAGAMVNLGSLYLNGHGVPQDYVKAREWYEKAAEKGFAPAMTALGLCFVKGEGVPQDYVKARQLFEKAAEKGFAGAMRNLGKLFYDGRGVSQNYVKAREWFEKAAAKGDADAMNALGILFARGQGVPQDYAKAREWYEKAAAAGHETAKENLKKLTTAKKR